MNEHDRNFNFNYKFYTFPYPVSGALLPQTIIEGLTFMVCREFGMENLLKGPSEEIQFYTSQLGLVKITVEKVYVRPVLLKILSLQ